MRASASSGTPGTLPKRMTLIKDAQIVCCPLDKTGPSRYTLYQKVRFRAGCDSPLAVKSATTRKGADPVQLRDQRYSPDARNGRQIVVYAPCCSVFVAAGLYWGVYLTNTKQRSLYRSTTVGLGFGLGAALLTYGFQLYYAIRINVGAFTGTDMAKASILSTSTASLYLDAVRNILVVLVYMGVAFLVGKNYLEKKRLAAWLTPIIVYVFIRFTDVILNTYAPALVAKIVYMVVLAFVAAVSVWIVRNWYQSEKQVKS